MMKLLNSKKNNLIANNLLLVLGNDIIQLWLIISTKKNIS